MATVVWGLAGQVAATEAFRTVGRGTVAQGVEESSSRLRWLPHRPSVPAAELGRPASLQLQAAKPPARLVQHNADTPFKDPFGDAKPALPLEDPGLVPLIPPGTEDFGGADPVPRSTSPNAEAGRAAGQLRSDGPQRLADELGTAALDLDYECPSIDDLKPIGEITYRTEPEPGEFPRDCPLDVEAFQPRHWAPSTFTWKASALCHKPLYFEDVRLERYGHSWGPLLQPVFSGAHFFGSVLALPYTAGMYPPHECMYTLGYYRPGSCAPYMLDPIPLSVRGAAVAGGIWTGGALVIP